MSFKKLFFKDDDSESDSKPVPRQVNSGSGRQINTGKDIKTPDSAKDNNPLNTPVALVYNTNDLEGTIGVITGSITAKQGTVEHFEEICKRHPLYSQLIEALGILSSQQVGESYKYTSAFLPIKLSGKDKEALVKDITDLIDVIKLELQEFQAEAINQRDTFTKDKDAAIEALMAENKQLREKLDANTAKAQELKVQSDNNFKDLTEELNEFVSTGNTVFIKRVNETLEKVNAYL